MFPSLVEPLRFSNICHTFYRFYIIVIEMYEIFFSDLPSYFLMSCMQFFISFVVCTDLLLQKYFQNFNLGWSANKWGLYFLETSFFGRIWPMTIGGDIFDNSQSGASHYWAPKGKVINSKQWKGED